MKTPSRGSALDLDGQRTWRPGRSWPTLLGLLAWIAVLSACQGEQPAAVQADLTAYMDHSILWAATEAKINTAIAGVRKDNFVHDDFVLETMRPAIGVARKYVVELEQHQPQWPALVSMHAGYIESWRAHEFAMVSIIDAIQRQDYVQLSRANDELAEAQRSVSDSLAALARLLREVGLAPDAPTGQQIPPPSQGFTINPSS